VGVLETHSDRLARMQSGGIFTPHQDYGDCGDLAEEHRFRQNLLGLAAQQWGAVIILPATG